VVPEGDWAGFDSCYARLLEVVPTVCRSFYRAWYLRICGRFDEAQREQERFEQAGPLSVGDWLVMATSRWVRCRFSEGIAVARRALERYPDNYDLHWILARCLLAAGDHQEAIRVIERGLGLWKGRELTSLLACANAGLGDLAKA
jgi:tetratricopeptide (TPR) repeat protein